MPKVEVRSPYVGPRPFEPKDRNLFFGRDREANELVSLVTAHRVVMLYSESGAGKSSLMNAGIVPRLEEEGFEVLPLARVSGRIPEEIPRDEISNLYVFNTLVSWAEEASDPLQLVHISLADFLRGREHTRDEDGLASPRVIILDQFEELFTSYPDRWRDREGFFKQVREALEADPLLRVIFVIREDYIAKLDPYVGLLPERLRTRFRLERLGKDAAVLAVTRPLRDTERTFAEGAAESLVNDLLRAQVQVTADETVETVGEFVEPVQLQVVCDALWHGLPNDVSVIEQSHLQTFGDASQALSRFYENSIKAAASGARVRQGKLRAWFERVMITPAGTRGTVFRGCEKTGGIANIAIDILENLHLIRGEWRAGSRWYELTHDRFIEPIRGSNEIRRRQQRRKWAMVGIPLAVIVVALLVIAPWHNEPPGQPMVLAPIGDRTVSVGDLLEVPVLASDPGGDRLTYSIIGGPEEAHLNPDTGLFSWTPDKAGKYVFVIQVDDGTYKDTQSVTVIVGEPVIHSFKANTSVISFGESCTLSWDVSYATEVIIDPEIGKVELTGIRVVSPTETTTYTLTAENEAGSVDATIRVIVGVQPPISPPIINLFAASRSSVEAGDSWTLNWNVSDATRVIIDPEIGKVALTGTRVVSPTETTTYTLTAENDSGSVDDTVQVIVLLSPPPVAGTVWAWGLNNYGQLGNGTTNNSSIPVQASNLTGVKAIAAGHAYSLALKSDGTVWAWGLNNYGQLGNGTTNNSSIPVQVRNLTGVEAIAVGHYHSLALKSDGTVWVWGLNNYGQLGNGTTNNSSIPVQVRNLTGVEAIAAGHYHSLVVRSGGTVWAWGLNNYGQLGNGTTNNSSIPVQVSNLTGVKAIAAGCYHSLVVRSGGTVWAWGWNDMGQLGNGTITQSITPVQVSGLTGVLAISGSGKQSLALKACGTVWGWGNNHDGQLGDGTTNKSIIPIPVTDLTEAQGISLNGVHSLVVKSDGSVWAWGLNNYGQLGNGTTNNSSIPVQVSNLARVKAIAAGHSHSLAVLK